MSSYWAQQECEVIPACVVRPRDVQQLCTAINIIRREFDEQRTQDSQRKSEGLFAVRSGGHSPIAGAASIKGGIIIDLRLFCEVIPSKDQSSVIIGTGANWMNVSKALDEKGLAVVGGRNSAVGVGGLALGGKLHRFTTYCSEAFLLSLRFRPPMHRPTFPLLHCSIADLEVQTGGLSFFSPRFGLVCSNILSYEIVLASGNVTTASASNNPDLWRALKGGSNNFGIVTRFTVRSFPSTKVWSGFLYMPGFQAAKVLAAFHESVSRVDSTYDNYAAGPLACFSYIPKLRTQAISVNLVYTKLPENEKKWPTYWRTSSFSSLWRLWSTCKLRSLTSATDEMNTLNPPGRRQVFATTTIKNDTATISATYAAYYDATTSIRRVNVKGLLWTVVLQPLLSDWVRKGDDNPLGLQDTHESLVVVIFTVNWDESRDDNFVKTLTRRTVEQIDAFATADKTGHPYRYLNYCADWQKPFLGYGEENLQFLRGVSRTYDPDGLFQKGCVGGFKLD